MAIKLNPDTMEWIEMTQEELEKSQKAFSEQFTEDFEPKWLARAKKQWLAEKLQQSQQEQNPSTPPPPEENATHE